MNPRYPIYIISKGRWQSRLTSKALEAMGVPYSIVVEPSEFEMYAQFIDKEKIITLPSDFSKLAQGGVPARNYVWEHALKTGAERHWILDDNITNFMRYNKNTRIRVDSGVVFRCIEDFVDRYENVAMAGMEYRYFIVQREKQAAFRLNTRIYSCILLRNDLSYRWRGKYNEDTDLSIRILKDGWCTILFQAFLCNKVATMTMRGGNTDTIYNTGDNRRKFAESLQRQHPDIANVVWRYNRWHHEVDYSGFAKNKLIKKEGIVIPKGVNNYGMVLKTLNDSPLEEGEHEVSENQYSHLE